MDTNAGRFVEEKIAERWMQRIEVDEIIKIKGEECRVVRINGRRLEVELLSSDDRLRREMGSILDAPRNRHERRSADAKKRKTPNA